jgi:ABC-2 type transport system permease protein
MYPLDHVPGWLTPLVTLNPITYAVDAMRQVAVGTEGHPIALDLAVLGAFAVITALLATSLFRRAY